ncbi:MAG: tripartite tricarboxylate transporter substrate binding protein [Pseudolabrys sp.]
MVRTLQLRLALTLFSVLIVSNPCSAEDVDYPTQTVRLISSFVAGGGNDFMARVLAQKLSEMGQVRDRGGQAGGEMGDIGTDYVARSAANGNTLLVTTNATIAINPQLFKDSVRFDPVKDFAPVSLLARQPFLLVANPNVPVKTLGELIDYARANPGKLNFGSSGAGGGAHLSGEMLKAFLNIKMTHVPYKGAGDALPALLGGQVDFMFVAILTARPFVESGKLRPLAVSSKGRNSSMPDVPAVSEYPGLEEFEADLWYGLLAPAKTNPAIVDKIYRATAHAFEDPKVKARFEPFGTVLVGSSPSEFSTDIKRDIGKWSTVIKAAGLGSP